MSDREKELQKELDKYKELYEAQSKTIDQGDRFSSSSSKVVGNLNADLGKWTLSVTESSNKLKTAFAGIGSAMNITDLSAFQELDERATIIQREFGATKGSIEGFKQSIADTIPELMKMGITEEQGLKNISKVMESMGSTATLGTEAITELSAAAEVSRVDIGKLATNFRDVGVSVYDVGEQMKEVTDYARSVGVSVAGVSDKVVGNLGKMNLYNFDNGIKGLAKMAATSERMGISMEQVFTFADKIYDPEGAIEMAAGLQRLGVTASGLLDPLRAMDLAANDPEGLQKEILNVTKEFTKFNEANGKFEIMPGSKRRMREIAKEMGIPAEELASMSIKAADFDMKMKQIQFPSLATDDETKEMIAGMAQLKDGKAMINIKNEQTGEVELKQVDQLTATDIDSLKKQQEDGSKSIEEIALNQLSVSEQIRNNTAGYMKTIEYGKATSEPLDKLFGTMMESQATLTRNLAAQATTKGVRETFTQIGQPVEDYIVGGIEGNTGKQRTAEKDFMTALSNAEQKMTASSQEFINTTLIDISNKFKEAYTQPQKVETKSEVTINVKLTGDENTRGINPAQLENGILEAMSKPEVSSVVSNQIAGGNQPSATTGSKNKQ
jgi:hypothetical protein